MFNTISHMKMLIKISQCKLKPHIRMSKIKNICNDNSNDNKMQRNYSYIADEKVKYQRHSGKELGGFFKKSKNKLTL